MVVLGDLVAEKLFPGRIPSGKKSLIAACRYRIVGVVAKQGTLFGISLDKFAIMPYTAPARRYICPINILDDIQIQTAGPDRHAWRRWTRSRR